MNFRSKLMGWILLISITWAVGAGYIYLQMSSAGDADLASSARQLGSLSFFMGIGAAVIIFLIVWFVTGNVFHVIHRTLNDLEAVGDRLISASGQISSSSQILAEGSSEQAASLEETSSSLEEMSSMTRTNAENANHADKIVRDALKDIGDADSAMTQLTSSMQEISSASDQTRKIVNTIDEISFQTNLLALNAAVEAARAGEAGAGFAVVADEVRNLAMRAAEAAKNTAQLIEQTVRKIDEGAQLVSKTNQAFKLVKTGAEKIGELVGEIAAASNEQAQGITQVNNSVADMDKVVQQNAANAEESASSAEEMKLQSSQLKDTVAQLAALVGRKNGSEEDVPAPKIRKSMPKKDQEFRPVKTTEKRPAARRSKEVRPDEIIPLDDNDFTDF
jgi:methyl-accepting chemotaxis protein